MQEALTTTYPLPTPHPYVNKQIAINHIIVTIPNRCVGTFAHICDIDIPTIPISAQQEHTFPTGVILSTDIICNTVYTTKLNVTNIIITHNKKIVIPRYRSHAINNRRIDPFTVIVPIPTQVKNICRRMRVHTLNPLYYVLHPAPPSVTASYSSMGYSTIHPYSPCTNPSIHGTSW